MNENGLTRSGVCLNSSKTNMKTKALDNKELLVNCLNTIISLHLHFDDTINDKIPNYRS
jgi:hypothetical protein